MRGKSWRRIARRYARRHGYFWLPCPLCGEEFGGQEWGGAAIAHTETETSSSGTGICARCAGTRLGVAERRLRALGEVLEISTVGENGTVRHRIGAFLNAPDDA